MTRILLHHLAAKRIQDRLARSVEMIILRDDGTFWLDDEPVSEEHLELDAAWMSNDLFRSEGARDFAMAVLKSPTIKWLQSASAGLDNSFFQNVMEKGVRISNSDAQARAIAEFVMAQVLAHFHPTRERQEAQREKSWQRFGFREIYETRWTIVGFGHIGSEIGKRARGFDAHVTGVRRTKGDHPYADAMESPDTLIALLPTSDVVVLACPLTQDTKGMVDAAFLEAMKEGATLVNVGRGDLIDEALLLQSLENGKPGFAILDVFEEEPLPPENPLWTNDRVCISAHTSAFGSGTQGRGDTLFLENVALFIAGEPLRNEIITNSG